MTNIAFIGLGIMGNPMAVHLANAGHTVAGFDRSPERADELVAAGGRAATSLADAVKDADVVAVMVPDSPDVQDVLDGEDRVFQLAETGTLIIDFSSIRPDVTQQLAEQARALGFRMLDAPVSGGGAAAEAGTLAIMAGGSTSAFDRAHPLLSCYAKTIVHIGPSGAGQVAKACNQICTIVNQLGAAEAMLLAERAGVDPRAVKEALMGGFAASRMLDLQAPKMIAREFEGKVESRLHHKDIHIVLELARKYGIELPASAAAAQVLDTLQQRGGARQDSAAIITVLDSPR